MKVQQWRESHFRQKVKREQSKEQADKGIAKDFSGITKK